MESHAPQITFHLFFFFFVDDQVHACSRLKQRLYDECGRITSGASPRLCCSFADSAALTSDRGTIFFLAYSFRGVVIGVPVEWRGDPTVTFFVACKLSASPQSALFLKPCIFVLDRKVRCFQHFVRRHSRGSQLSAQVIPAHRRPQSGLVNTS